MQREIVPLPQIEPVRGYSPQHAALYLDVSDQTVYKLIKEGKLPSRVVGRRRVVPGSELIKFLTGEEPVLKGDPIDPSVSELKRTVGSLGGLAKARKAVSGPTGVMTVDHAPAGVSREVLAQMGARKSSLK